MNHNKKAYESSPKLQLNYSFTKEFINTFPINDDDEDEEENNNKEVLAKSHFGLGDFEKMQEQILGEANEVLMTILDEKIKKRMYSKNINIPKIKSFSSQNDIDVNDIENNNILSQGNFLKIREIPEISNEKFQILKYDLLDENYLEELKHFILDFKYEVNSANTTLAIGSLFPLEKLIESNFNNDVDFSDEMISKYNLYKNYIFNYRTIKADGNCFYRAVIFRYFEIIILNKDIALLQNIIFDMKNSFYSNEIIERKEIKMNTVFKPELPLKIMLIILDLIKKNNEELAHFIFLKCLLICPIFDFGLIFYFRYIFYTYIKENEDKLYLKNFPIKIGNLLPSKYETEDGEFLFNSFYQNYLLKMFMDAEKIIIYLTPFILGMNLDIIVFDDDSELIKKINYDGKAKYSFEDIIFLMNRKYHYELLYSKKENEKYKTFFKKYINNDFLKDSIIFYEYNKNNENISNIFDKQKSINKNYIINNNISDSNFSQNINDNRKERIIKKMKVKKKVKIKKFRKKLVNKNDTYLNDLDEKNDEELIINNNQINESPNRNEKKNNIHYNTIEALPKNNNKIINSSRNTKSYIINKTIDNNYEENEKKVNPFNFAEYENRQLDESINKMNEETKIKSQRNKIIHKENKNLIKKDYNMIENNSLKKKSNEKEENEDMIPPELNIQNSNISNTIDNTNKNNKVLVKKKVKKKKKKSSKITNVINLNSIHTNNQENSQIINEKNIINSNRAPIINGENKIIEEINTDINTNKNNKRKRKSLKFKNDFKNCKKCSEKYLMNKKNEININLCYECLKKEIIESFYDVYASYIKECLDNKYENDVIENKFNDLFTKTIKINNEISIPIKNGVNQLCSYDNENSSFVEIKQELILEIKQNFCLICCHKMVDNRESTITIPCNCNFCDIKHFEYFFNNAKSLEKGKELVCYCSYKYNIKDIYNLGLIFSEKNQKLLRKSVIDYLNDILIGKCCNCQSNQTNLDRIRYKDKSEENNKLLAKYKELKHYFCNSCIEIIKEKDSFLCKICYKEHIFRSKK